MTIPLKQLNVRKVSMRLKNAFTTSFGSLQNKEFFIIEAVDKEGNHGYGESVAFRAPWYTEETVHTTLHMIEDFLVPILKTNEIKHPDDIYELFKPIRRNNMAKAAIEGAIWDLFAKRKNIPLAEALGGERKIIESGVSIGIQPTVRDLINTIETYLHEGYKRIKIKVKPGRDIEDLREVRAHFPDTPIMADANSAYSLKDIEHLKRFDEFGLMMIEQPLAHDDIVDHAKLQAELQTPICLDESIHSLSDVRHAYELESCKIINVKIGRVGGLSEAKRIHNFCLDKNMEIWCGGMLEAGVGRAHNIALSSLKQFVLPGDTSGSSRYWEKDIIKPEVVVKDGVIQVPDKAGIGYKIDEEALKEVTDWVKEFRF